MSHFWLLFAKVSSALKMTQILFDVNSNVEFLGWFSNTVSRLFLCTKNFSTSSTTHYFFSSTTCSGWQPSLHIGSYAPSALMLGLFIITLALERLVNPWVHAHAEMERDFCIWYFPTSRKPIEVRTSLTHFFQFANFVETPL